MDVIKSEMTRRLGITLRRSGQGVSRRGQGVSRRGQGFKSEEARTIPLLFRLLIIPCIALRTVYRSFLFGYPLRLFDLSLPFESLLPRLTLPATSPILCLTSRTTVTSARIPEEDACHRATYVSSHAFKKEHRD